MEKLVSDIATLTSTALEEPAPQQQQQIQPKDVTETSIPKWITYGFVASLLLLLAALASIVMM